MGGRDYQGLGFLDAGLCLCLSAVDLDVWCALFGVLCFEGGGLWIGVVVGLPVRWGKKKRVCG